jgi:hypothetical protein
LSKLDIVPEHSEGTFKKFNFQTFLRAPRQEPRRARPDNRHMKNLRPETMGILEKVAEFSGRPVEFKPDSSLTLRATMQLARDGAPTHVLHYRPTNEPIDYWVAYQAGYLLRLVELPPDERYDFAGTGEGASQVEAMFKVAQQLRDSDKAVLPEFAQMSMHWALMNLRSYAIGMRIDQWLWSKYPELRELQAAGIDEMQQENVQVLSKRLGNLAVPVPLLASVAAYALFADRLIGKSLYSIPYRAAGALTMGQELLDISDSININAVHDRELVDAWASAMGMTDWYVWKPYRP